MSTTSSGQSYLCIIKRNAQALLQQVNDLLDLGRIDVGKMPLIHITCWRDIAAATSCRSDMSARMAATCGPRCALR